MKYWLRHPHLQYSRLTTGPVGDFISRELAGTALEPGEAAKMQFTLVRLDPPANPKFTGLFFVPWQPTALSTASLER